MFVNNGCLGRFEGHCTRLDSVNYVDIIVFLVCVFLGFCAVGNYEENFEMRKIRHEWKFLDP